MNMQTTERQQALDDLAEHVIRQVKEEGVCVVADFFSSSECTKYIAILENILEKRIKNGLHFGSRNTQVIYNYFFYSQNLYNLFFNPLIDKVMTKLIDEDFVLISPSARNPRIRPDFPEGQKTSGVGWHVDSRVYNKADGSLYRPSMSFYAAVALEDFVEGNSATNYVPRSHLLYKKPLDRDADINYETLVASAGSLIFFDSAMWHRVGVPTEASRWSIFNMYGPWFMKPYFRFLENYDEEKIKNLPPEIRKILHSNSTPPRNENEGLVTLVK